MALEPVDVPERDYFNQVWQYIDPADQFYLFQIETLRAIEVPFEALPAELQKEWRRENVVSPGNLYLDIFSEDVPYYARKALRMSPSGKISGKHQLEEQVLFIGKPNGHFVAVAQRGLSVINTKPVSYNDILEYHLGLPIREGYSFSVDFH